MERLDTRAVTKVSRLFILPYQAFARNARLFAKLSHGFLASACTVRNRRAWRHDKVKQLIGRFPSHVAPPVPRLWAE